jgi:hypothetical protein
MFSFFVEKETTSMEKSRPHSRSSGRSTVPRTSKKLVHDAAIWYESDARGSRSSRVKPEDLEISGAHTARQFFVEAFDTSKFRNHLERLFQNKDGLAADARDLFQRALNAEIPRSPDFDVGSWFRYLRGRLAEREDPEGADEIYSEIEERISKGGLQHRYDCLMQRGRLRQDHPSRFREDSEIFFRKAAELNETGKIPILLLRGSEIDETSQVSFDAVTRLLKETDTSGETRTWMVEESCRNSSMVNILDRVYTEHRDASLGRKVHVIMYEAFLATNEALSTHKVAITKWIMRYDRTCKFLYFDGLLSLEHGSRDAVPQLLLAYERNLKEGRRSDLRRRILISLGHAFLAQRDRLRAARFFSMVVPLPVNETTLTTLPFSEIPTEFAKGADDEGGHTFADLEEESRSMSEQDLLKLMRQASSGGSELKLEFVFKTLKYLREEPSRSQELELARSCSKFLREVLNSGSLRQVDVVLSCLARAPERSRKLTRRLLREEGSLTLFEKAVIASTAERETTEEGTDRIVDELMKVPKGHASRSRALYFAARRTQDSSTTKSGPNRGVRIVDALIEAWIGGVHDSFAMDIETRLERLFESSEQLREMEWTETGETWDLKQLVFSRLISGLESKLTKALATKSSESDNAAVEKLQKILDMASFLGESDGVLRDDVVNMIRELPQDFKERCRTELSLDELGMDMRSQVESHLKTGADFSQSKSERVSRERRARRER